MLVGPPPREVHNCRETGGDWCAETTWGRIPLPTIARHNNAVAPKPSGRNHVFVDTTAGSGESLRVSFQESISDGYAKTLLRILCEWRWTGKPSSRSQRRAVASFL